MCARIRGTNLPSCIQCSQGLATACSACSGLGQHQSAEECIPAPSQVGSLQSASVTVLENSECNGSACRKEPVLLTLPMPTWASCRAREGGYSAVRVLTYTPSCSFTQTKIRLMPEGTRGPVLHWGAIKHGPCSTSSTTYSLYQAKLGKQLEPQPHTSTKALLAPTSPADSGTIRQLLPARSVHRLAL